MKLTRKWTLKGQTQRWRREHFGVRTKTASTLVGAAEETPGSWEEQQEAGEATYEYYADTGGEEYERHDYPEDDRVEFLPILALTVLVFTLGFAVGRCTKR